MRSFDESPEFDFVANSEVTSEAPILFASWAVSDNPEPEFGICGHESGHGMDQNVKVLFDGDAPAVEGDRSIWMDTQDFAGSITWGYGWIRDAGWDDGNGPTNLVAAEPVAAEFAGCDDVTDSVVIVVSVFSDFVLEELVGEERDVVGVFVVQRVVGGYEGDIVRFGPAEANESDGKGGVGVDEIEFVLAEFAQQGIERGKRERISRRKWGLCREKSVGVGVLVFVTGVSGCEEVDGVSSFAKSFDEGVNADAHPIQNGEGTIGKDGDVQRPRGHALYYPSGSRPCSSTNLTMPESRKRRCPPLVRWWVSHPRLVYRRTVAGHTPRRREASSRVNSGLSSLLIRSSRVSLKSP